MSQLKTVFKFEYSGYLKSKAFQITTGVLLAFAVIASFVPQIGALFSGLSGEKKKAGVTAESFNLSPEALNLYANKYIWETVAGSEDALKGLVDGGDYAVIVDYKGGAAYDFYTTGRSMNDLLAASGINALISDIYIAEQIKDLGPDAKTAVDLTKTTVITANAISTGEGDFETNYFLAYVFVFVLYMTMMMYNQFVLTSVITEKTSKAMELLVTSAKTHSLIFGKVFGVGCAALTQLLLLLIVGGGSFYLNRASFAASSEGVPIDQIINVALGSPFLIFSFLVFFILGYFLYAFLCAALGSTVSRIEDASAVSMLPTMFGVIAFMVSVIGGMNAIDAVPIRVLSYVPFFAPMIMFMRYCLNAAEVWQVCLSMAISAAAVVLTGFAAAKIYKTGVMLYGKPLNPKEIFKMLAR